MATAFDNESNGNFFLDRWDVRFWELWEIVQWGGLPGRRSVEIGPEVLNVAPEN